MKSYSQLISVCYKHQLIDPNKYIDVHEFTGHSFALGVLFCSVLSSVLDIFSNEPHIKLINSELKCICRQSDLFSEIYSMNKPACCHRWRMITGKYYETYQPLVAGFGLFMGFAAKR